MKEIPKHCIELFREKFNTYPSTVEVHISINNDNFKKILNKSQLLWYEDIFNDNGEIKSKNKLFEYDSTGILIYIKEECNIFIMTKVDKKNIVDFTLQQLKKLKK
jgi:hypothetical protein